MAELEPYIILANSQKGRACAALISQVLSNKKIFAFGELLDVASVAALVGTEHEAAYQTLKLFAYGTWRDYRRGGGSSGASSSGAASASASASASAGGGGTFLDLSEAQATKLKMLTIVSLAEQQKILAYATLLQELEVESVRALEDLIIDTMYNGLVAGKIDQRQGIFRVKSAVGRDVPPDKVADVAHQLGLWQTRCSALIEALEASSRRVADEREVGWLQQNAAQRLANEVKAKIKDDIASGEFRDAREDDDDDYGPRGGMDGGPGRAGRMETGSRKRKNPRGITGLGTMGGFGGGGGGDMDIDG